MPSVKAPHGQRMLQLVLDFWTDGIAPEGWGHIVPKVAWDYGMVNIRAKKAHGIKSAEPIPFNSFDEIPQALRTAIDKAGITLQEPPARRRRV